MQDKLSERCGTSLRHFHCAFKKVRNLCVIHADLSLNGEPSPGHQGRQKRAVERLLAGHLHNMKYEIDCDVWSRPSVQDCASLFNVARVPSLRKPFVAKSTSLVRLDHSCNVCGKRHRGGSVEAKCDACGTNMCRKENIS